MPDPEDGKKPEEKTGALPETLTIKHSTGDKVIPLEKALELAGRGLDYDVRERGLSEREQRVAQQEQALPEFGRLKQQLEGSPRGVDALRLVIEDAAGVVAAYERAQSGDDSEDGGDPGDPSARQPKSSAELEGLRREMGELKSTISDMSNSSRSDKVRTAATEVLSQYPWLKDKSTGGLNVAGAAAYKDMLSRIQQDGNVSFEVAAAASATEMKKILEMNDGASVTRQQEREVLSLSDLSKATAALSQDKPLTKEDLGSGRLTDMALKVAKSMGFDQV